MEDAGLSLFDFIQNAHELIANGKVDLSHWKAVIRLIFKQMLEAIEYIHHKNVCHFDISLGAFHAKCYIIS